MSNEHYERIMKGGNPRQVHRTDQVPTQHNRAVCRSDRQARARRGVRR
jgi:hypothetical protein